MINKKENLLVEVFPNFKGGYSRENLENMKYSFSVFFYYFKKKKNLKN